MRSMVEGPPRKRRFTLKSQYHRASGAAPPPPPSAAVPLPVPGRI